MPQVFAGAVLVSWACAKANTPDPGVESFTPSGATSGRGGSAPHGTGGTGGTTPSGVGGTTAATGGFGAATGGGSGTGGAGASTAGASTGGTHAAGGVGGSTSGAGHNGSGGSTVTAGRSATGGTNSAGGVSNNGGNGSGAGPGLGGATTGGKGAAGAPSDPNWKPPNMTATAKLLVLYQAAQTAASSTDVRMTLTLQNQTDTPYDLSNVTMRYWMSSEPPPNLSVDYSYQGLKLSSTLQFVPNMANSYILFTFGKGGVVPPSTDPNAANSAQIQARAQTAIGNVNFNEANDWSFDPTATAAKPNPKMTIYDGTTLIWGCEPSHVCAAPPSTGEAGAGGQSGL